MFSFEKTSSICVVFLDNLCFWEERKHIIYYILLLSWCCLKASFEGWLKHNPSTRYLSMVLVLRGVCRHRTAEAITEKGQGFFFLDEKEGDVLDKEAGFGGGRLAQKILVSEVGSFVMFSFNNVFLLC